MLDLNTGTNYKPQLRQYTDVEKTALVILAQKGNDLARRKLMEVHYPFLVSVSSRMYKTLGVANTILSVTDLIGSAAAGLNHAISKYSASRDNKFMTYAVWWITAFVRRQVNEDSRTVRLPHTILNLPIESEIRKKAIAAELSDVTGGRDGQLEYYVTGHSKTPLDIVLELELQETAANVEKSIRSLANPRQIDSIQRFIFDKKGDNLGTNRFFRLTHSQRSNNFRKNKTVMNNFYKNKSNKSTKMAMELLD